MEYGARFTLFFGVYLGCAIGSRHLMRSNRSGFLRLVETKFSERLCTKCGVLISYVIRIMTKCFSRKQYWNSEFDSMGWKSWRKNFWRWKQKRLYTKKATDIREKEYIRCSQPKSMRLKWRIRQVETQRVVGEHIPNLTYSGSRYNRGSRFRENGIGNLA